LLNFGFIILEASAY